MQHFKREISPRLTKREAQAIIAQWNGSEATRDAAIRQLTEWQPVKLIKAPLTPQRISLGWSPFHTAASDYLLELAH